MELFKIIMKHHAYSIILFFISINILIGVTTLLEYDSQLKYMTRTMDFNINEYGEIDREHLCHIIECKQAIDLEHHKYFISNGFRLKKEKWQDFNKIHIIRNIYLINFNISIYNEYSNTYFVLDNTEINKEMLTVMTLMLPIIFILFLYPLIISIKKEKETAIINHVGNEALLANKSMIMITENIHHELNTPLEIIDNKIEKIHKVIDDYLIGEYENQYDDIDTEISYNKNRQSINKQLVKLQPDFEFIKTSSEQIYNILDKMKGFKHMRYSNGNKSITDIFESAFKIISISNSNYSYTIDNELSGYSISSNKFRNADLLGIIINNIKNSLEASASKIYILYIGYKKGSLTLRIIDNGSGIPKEIQKKVFEPNFSTKSQDKSIRGNGMYLNKQILTQAGGTTKIVESSKNGTTLEISIPTKKKENL